MNRRSLLQKVVLAPSIGASRSGHMTAVINLDARRREGNLTFRIGGVAFAVGGMIKHAARERLVSDDLAPAAQNMSLHRRPDDPFGFGTGPKQFVDEDHDKALIANDQSAEISAQAGLRFPRVTFGHALFRSFTRKFLRDLGSGARA